MKIDQRPISKASSFFQKPSHVKNLFGARRDCPKIRAWLEKQIEDIRVQDSVRFRKQWSFDVEQQCFVDDEPTTTTHNQVDVNMEPIPAYYEPVVVHEKCALAPVFATFRTPIRRTLSSPSSPAPKKKSPLDISAPLVRTKSVQASLLGSLAVTKTNSIKNLSVAKKLDSEAVAPPLVSREQPTIPR